MCQLHMDLPPELVQEVALYLRSEDVRNCLLVSRSWKEMLDIDKIWKRLSIQCFGAESQSKLQLGVQMMESCEWRQQFWARAQLTSNWRENKICAKFQQRYQNFANLNFENDELIVLYNDNRMDIWNVKKHLCTQTISLDNTDISFFKLMNSHILILQGAVLSIYKKNTTNYEMHLKFNVVDDKYDLIECECNEKYLIIFVTNNEQSCLFAYDNNLKKCPKFIFDKSNLSGLIDCRAYIKASNSLVCFDMKDRDTKYEIKLNKNKLVHVHEFYIAVVAEGRIDLYNSFNGEFLKGFNFGGHILNLSKFGPFYYAVLSDNSVKIFDFNNSEVSQLKISFGFVHFYFLWFTFAAMKGVVQSAGFQPFFNYYELCDFGQKGVKKINMFVDESVKYFINTTKTGIASVKYNEDYRTHLVEILYFWPL